MSKNDSTRDRLLAFQNRTLDALDPYFIIAGGPGAIRNVFNLRGLGDWSTETAEVRDAVKAELKGLRT